MISESNNTSSITRNLTQPAVNTTSCSYATTLTLTQVPTADGVGQI